MNKIEGNYKNIGQYGSNYTNNPLGIIGLFLVLVDGIAALVIIFSELNLYLNSLLVLFVVSFPIIVLRSFYILVTKHHSKLYSPKDYKDEKNFLKTFDFTSNQLVMTDKLDHYDNNQTDVNYVEQFTIIKQTLHNIAKVQESLFKTVTKDAEVIELEKEVKKNLEQDLPKVINKRRYRIKVSNFDNANEFVNILQEYGYECSVYSSDPEKPIVSAEGHEAIWLGNNVPLDMAVEIIKIAKKEYPFLRYIHLTEDTKGDPPPYIHNQLYIGGSTKTATNNYNISYFTDEDFNRMYKFINKRELHLFIRSHYQK